MNRVRARVEDELLERESELAHGAGLLDQARDGRGRPLAVEGQAGIGKSALLEALCGLAEELGFVVLRARGAELEQDFPQGVVRQLSSLTCERERRKSDLDC